MHCEDDRVQDHCGVIGIYAPGQEVSRLCYFGLLALQHRGQESAGIAVSDGRRVVVYKDMGLVSQVFRDDASLASLLGDIAVGHVRYSTTGSSRWENAQPLHLDGGRIQVALAHNGNLVNTMNLADHVGSARRHGDATSDSELIAEMIVSSSRQNLFEAVAEVVPLLRGAFTLTLSDEKTLIGVRDPLGLRPLVLGRFAEGGFALASETCALDAMGATFVRDIEPGEVVAIDASGVKSHRYAEPDPKLCIFEFVYFARPDSNLYGQNVQEARFRMGKSLANEAPADADLVVPVPDSGRGAAAGYADESGIPFGEGFVKNSYVGRTFIQPTSRAREQGVGAKLNPIAPMIKGKRVVVVDDSIVRGITTRRIVDMLRKAGATEVHLRISSPPIRWPCFYGIDTANRDELIAAHMTVDEIREHVNADSLAYLSLNGMVAATEVSEPNFCHACFSAKYPVEVPQEVRLSKNMLEQV